MIYDFPVTTRLPKKLAEGWQVTAFVQTRTGLPVNIIGEQAGWFVIPRRADCVPGVSQRPSNYAVPGDKDHLQFTPGAFLPPAGEFGTCSRNAARGPGFFQPDLALSKNTKINERVTWQFRGEVFNAINHPNFLNPDGNIASPNFGRSTSTVSSLVGIGTSRQIQLTMKFLF